jgi:hypothetical protein
MALAIMFAYAMEAGMQYEDHSFAKTFSNSIGWPGPVSVVGGLADVVIAIILLALRKNKYGAGFVLSAVALLLTGYLCNTYYT